MLYDTVYYLGHLFQLFLRDNPDLLEETPLCHFSDDETVASAKRAAIAYRLLEWLETQSVGTDPVQRAILLHMVQEYVQLESGGEVLQILIAS